MQESLTTDAGLPPEFFSRCDGYSRLDLALECSFAEAVNRIDEAIRYCRETGESRLLVDIRQLTGFPTPGVLDRFHFAEVWSKTAQGRVRLAVISRPELIDREKIGVTMARNRGLAADVFEDETEGLNWLLR